jgi:molecular chaperone Hsp33
MSELLAADDLIQPFRIDSLVARGRLVRLGGVVDAILMQHDYPEPVSVLLGEALALTAALADTLKFDGTFTTQIQGDGPIRLMIADYRTDGAMRGYAGFDATTLDQAALAGAAGDAGLFGAGHLAFTVDQGPDQDRYQSVVPLEGSTLAETARSYLTRSEQLRAEIDLAAVRWPAENGTASGWRAGCLVVQQMPDSDGRSGDDRARVTRWAETRAQVARLRRADLADPLAIAPALIGPLFREYDVRMHVHRPVRFECRCSHERARNVVHALPEADRVDLAIEGQLEITCDYCNAQYLFGVDGSPIDQT